MPGRSLRIARIAGIPVGISPWWLAIVALITWSLGASYFPEAVHGIAPIAAYALGFASALLLFASILAHEFGHALVARRYGIEIEEIDLWLLGGVSRMRGEAHAPREELRYALAGPLVTAVVAACFGVVALLLPVSTPAAVRALVEYQVFVNALIFVFNLLPAFPLDGGRVLRSLLWRRSGERARATATAASVGRTFGYLLVFLGGLELLAGAPQGLWLALIGFFIVLAAGAQAAGAQLQEALGGLAARELMSAPVIGVPASLSAARAASDFFAVYRYTAFPVLDADGQALGVLTLDRVRALTSEQREHVCVAELAERDPALLIDADENVVGLLERGAFVRVGRAVVLDAVRRPVGLLSITDVERALRAASLGGRPPSQTSTGGRGGRPAHAR
jgi:Zn-dependent protease